MPALSEKDQAELLIRVLECSSQTEGWPQVLEFIDRSLRCTSFLAEFDGTGGALPHFGGQQPAEDLGSVLEQIETEGGRNALQFLLSEASLFYPYCKTALDRNNTTTKRDLSAQSQIEIEPAAANRTAGYLSNMEASLNLAPGLVSPIWRTDTSTILFGCLFPDLDPNSIDVAVASETFRRIVKALAPGLNLHFQMERQRADNLHQEALLSEVEGPAILVSADRDILAQTPSCMDVLDKTDTASQRQGKLQVKNKQLDAALLELAVATRHPPDRPVPGTEKLPQRAVFFTDQSGSLKRILIKTIYPSGVLAGHAPAPMFVLKLSQARDVPKDVERCLQDHFDLSQSESHLARHLTVTGSMNATVDDLGITRNTAKTHLRRIYEKTGVNTQLQLARLVHNLAQLF